MAEYGVEGTTTARIAAAAGISEKTLYSHFASRKDILVAALDVVFERARDDLRHLEGANVLEHLRALPVGTGRGGRSSCTRFSSSSPLPRPPVCARRCGSGTRPASDIVASMIDEGKAQGVIRPDVDSEHYGLGVLRRLLGRGRRVHDRLRRILGQQTPGDHDGAHPAGHSRTRTERSVSVMKKEAFAKNIEVLGYNDLDGRPGFQMAMQVVDGRYYLYLAHFKHCGWTILDVTDPRETGVPEVRPGPG